MSNVDIELSTGLNIDQSVQQIKTDIASVQKRLDSAGIKISLKAEILDEELKKSLSKIGNMNETAVIGKKMGDNLATNLINAYRATGNALTLKDGKYYNADGTLHKGAKYSRVISSLAEKQIQKTATSFEKNLLADIAPVKGYTGPKSTNPSVSKGSGGGGNKGKSDPKENSTIDWISRSAELLERKSEELKTAISDTSGRTTGGIQ